MIPKKIHYCWFGGNPKPALAEKCIKSWKKYCPEYEIIEWNEDNYDHLKNDFMREAYEVKKWGFVPAYARLDIIYKYGGIYLDTDVEIVKPVDPLLEYRGFMGFESDNYLALGLGFGAEAGNEIIKALRDSYENRHFVNPDGSLNIIPSPQCDSAVLERMGVKRNGKLQEKDGFVFLPAEYLNPISLDTGKKRITGKTYSVHWYAGSWIPPEEKKENIKKQKKALRAERKGKRHDLVKRIIGAENYNKLKELVKRN